MSVGQAESVSGKRAFGAVVFLIALAIMWHLRQRDLEFVFEADFDTARITLWRTFLHTWNLASLPRPYPHPYLDAAYMLSAVMAETVRAAAYLFPALHQSFPNDTSYSIAGVMLLHILSESAATVVFYAAFARLTGIAWLSALLSLMVIISPQMTEIGVLRPDHLIMLLIAVIFLASVRITQSHDGIGAAVALGVALGILSTIKINGPFFGLLPAFAVAALTFSGQLDMRRIARTTIVSLMCFVVVYTAFMLRFWVYMGPLGVVDYYRQSIALVNQWSAYLGRESVFFYNIDLLEQMGRSFIVLYLAAAAYVVYSAVRTRTSEHVFLALCFIGFSIGGMWTLKYIRGGYHLLPIFFAMIGVAAAGITRSPSLPTIPRAITQTAVAVALALTLWFSGELFLSRSAQLAAEPVGIEIVKRAPRVWLSQNAGNGKICVEGDSLWTLPPLEGLPLSYTYPKGLVFPYLDEAKMKQTEPPDLAALREECSLIVLSDWHRVYYQNIFTAADPALGKRWAQFFQRLNIYPHRVFESAVPAGGVYRVEIYDLRGQ